jgi:hypothetical protein
MQNWLDTREEKRFKRHATGDEVDSADDLSTVYEGEEEEEEEANGQQQTGGRRVVATFEDPTTALAAAEMSGEEGDGVIFPRNPTAGRSRRNNRRARQRRDDAELRNIRGTSVIGVLNQVLADENHTALRVQGFL